MPELMEQREIARLSRRSPVSINYICNRVRPAGRRMAEDLEEVTGIGRESWIWPDRWFNPYVKGSSPKLPKAEEVAGKKFSNETILRPKPKPREEKPDNDEWMFGIFGKD